MKLKPRAPAPYLRLTKIHAEVFPLLLGSVLHYSIPLSIVLKNSGLSAKDAEEVKRYLIRQNLAQETPQGIEFTLQAVQRVRETLATRFPDPSANAPGLDMTRQNPVPAVHTLLSEFQHASESNRRGKLVPDARAFVIFRGLCREFKPEFVRMQIAPFFQAAEINATSVTFRDFDQWLRRTAGDSDRQVKISKVYADVKKPRKQ